MEQEISGHRSVGPAHDRFVKAMGMSYYPKQLGIACPPTDSLPVDQIMTVNDLTQDIFAMLEGFIPKENMSVKLCVQLLDIGKNNISEKNWIVSS